MMSDGHLDRIREQFTRQADAYSRMRQITDERGLAALVALADGTLPDLALARRMDDEALVERLTAVHGIGRWTAEMLLIFRLGRPDVLPVDDLGIRSGFSVVFRKRGRPTREEFEARGERWRPYRTVASL